jgi:hypothetical protein
MGTRAAWPAFIRSNDMPRAWQTWMLRRDLDRGSCGPAGSTGWVESSKTEEVLPVCPCYTLWRVKERSKRNDML